MPNEGFDGIAVGLLGNCSPIGVFFSAIFFGALKMGKGSLAATGIPTELADTIIAVIIYFTATNVIIASFWNNMFKNSYEKKEEAIRIAMEEDSIDKPIESLYSKERKALIAKGKALIKSRKEGK